MISEKQQEAFPPAMGERQIFGEAALWQYYRAHGSDMHAPPKGPSHSTTTLQWNISLVGNWESG